MSTAISGNMNKALFIDRDGVINKEKDYVYRIEDFEFIEGAFGALKQAGDLGYKIIIITNQAGIARGLFTEEDFHKITQWMYREFEKQGVQITDVFYDPYHPVYGKGKYKKDSVNRKPNPGMILEAVKKYRIDVKQSALAGDKMSDIEAGKRAGVGRLFLVRTGYPVNLHAVPEGCMVADSLLEVIHELKRGKNN